MTIMNCRATTALVLLLATGAWGQFLHAHPSTDFVNTAALRDAPAYAEAELAHLVGPFALYPDELVAIVLPATTYPLQLIQAAWFLDALEDDQTLQPDPEWDESIIALLNYPEALRLLNQDLDRSRRLGEAVLTAESAVLGSIQDFRARAIRAGNLRSDEHQVVVKDNDGIRILLTDPEVVYVPYYEPQRVVVYSTVPVYRYHPRRYRVYYRAYPPGYGATSLRFWNVSSAFVIGWHSGYVHRDGQHGRPLRGRSHVAARVSRQQSTTVSRTRRPAPVRGSVRPRVTQATRGTSVAPARQARSTVRATRDVERLRARGQRARSGPVRRGTLATVRPARRDTPEMVSAGSPGRARLLAAADPQTTSSAARRPAARRAGSERNRNANRAGSRQQAARSATRGRARLLAAAEPQTTGSTVARRAGSERNRNANRAGSRQQAAGSATGARNTPRATARERRSSASSVARTRRRTAQPRTFPSKENVAIVAARRRALEAMPPDP